VPRLRLGVALVLPAPTDGEVDGLRRALGDGALGRIPPHLTLVPPVNVARERLEEALAVLSAAASDVPPLDLQLGPPASFWPVTPVVYLSVDGSEPSELAALHHLRRSVFRPPLERTLTHPFVPHVTLAEEMKPSLIPAALEALRAYRRQVRLATVSLLEEVEGRVWVPLAQLHLGAASISGRGGLPVEITSAASPDAAARARAGAAPIVAVTARRQGVTAGVAELRLIPTQPARARLVELTVVAGERGSGVGSALLAAGLRRVVEQWETAEAECRVAPASELGAFLRRRGWAEDGGGRLVRGLS
jgi:2'-5' RNA ligase